MGSNGNSSGLVTDYTDSEQCDQELWEPYVPQDTEAAGTQTGATFREQGQR